MRVLVKAGGQSDRTTTHVSVLETCSAAATKTIRCTSTMAANIGPYHRIPARGPLDPAASLMNATSVPFATPDFHRSLTTAMRLRARRTSAIASRTMARGRDHPLEPNLGMKLNQTAVAQRHNRPSCQYAWSRLRQQRRTVWITAKARRSVRSAWRNMKSVSRWFDWSACASSISGALSSGLRGKRSVRCIRFHRPPFSSC